jgi:hypothetical protein
MLPRAALLRFSFFELNAIFYNMSESGSGKESAKRGRIQKFVSWLLILVSAGATIFAVIISLAALIPAVASFFRTLLDAFTPIPPLARSPPACPDITESHNSPWGIGDLVSIATGLIVLGLCLCFRPRHRNIPDATVALASGMSLGPLLLIIFDPVTQLLGTRTRFFEIVISEGRATLWWAAVVAALYVVRDLVK